MKADDPIVLREPSAKLLIIHADDLGMCHSINRAIFSAFEKNAISSASAMAPCPWFPEVVEMALNTDYDIGLHITLTSEWTSCKWRPILPSRSFVDEHGYFWPDGKPLRGTEPSASAEIAAQIKFARQAGLDVSHLDSHMFVVFQNIELFHAYSRIAREFDLPFLYLPRLLPEVNPAGDLPLFRAVVYAPRDLPASSWEDYYLNVIEDLAPGLTQLIVHPGFDEPELRALTGSNKAWDAAWRQRDYDVLLSKRFRNAIQEHEVHLVNYRVLRGSRTGTPRLRQLENEN